MMQDLKCFFRRNFMKQENIFEGVEDVDILATLRTSQSGAVKTTAVRHVGVLVT